MLEALVNGQHGGKNQKETLQSRRKLTSFVAALFVFWELTSENRGCCTDVRGEKKQIKCPSRRRRGCGFGSRRRISLRCRCFIVDLLRSPSRFDRRNENKRCCIDVRTKKRNKIKFNSRRVDVPLRQSTTPSW